MSANMKLWESVSKTPSAHIQAASVSGQNRKTVKAVFQKEKATEMFGCYGQDWGVVVGSENYDRNVIGDTHLLHYTAVMFYTYNERRGEFPIAASISEARIVKRGQPTERLMVDDEAIKKVRTDALTKGLSELGFNADIFKGWHDQSGYSDYVSSVIVEEETEKAEKETIKEAEEYAQWKAKELDFYSNLNTMKAIETAFTGHVRKATKIGDVKGVKQFTEAKEARIQELKNNG